MKIGFSQNYTGPGGARSWIKGFSEFCIDKGHSVVYGFDTSVDVFCSVANLSKLKELQILKENNIKILQRLGAIYLPYNHPNSALINLKNTELKNLISCADSIVYQSKFSKEVLFRSIYDGNEPDGDIIYNSADANIFTPLGDKIPKSNNKKVILAVAYWGTPHTAQESIDLLKNIIKYYENREDIEFWVLGRAFEPQELMLRSSNLSNIGKLDLLNPIRLRDMPQLLRSADIILHLKAHEGCSNSVIEAMNVGTPLVGINSGSLPELVADSALLCNCSSDISNFPIVDFQDLINKIDLTLENIPQFSNRMLERGKNFSYENTYSLYLDKLLSLYNQN